MERGVRLSNGSARFNRWFAYGLGNKVVHV
jgi:hypothetical protein